ncbi:hypothetical protein TSA66_05070 [Noviherbaspirillum autotrophicum]|uniref:DUF2726 domain-containing protein n=2 Tax=Noviherbaspirillum autotrophicum TaxID=709839 RepID=A0A0C1XZV7_9BURK|nr:hypothetical protein TSA66_05070 [Noviherbaspirillum autotrophicum]
MKDAIVMVAIVLGGLFLWLFLHREKPMRFRQRAVLTGCDLEFFFRLSDALPECIVCPQVAMSALLEPAGTGVPRQQAMAQIAGGRVGYAVFDREMRLLAVVELNHRSRATRRETARDACLSSAGIKIVRFHAKHLPSPKQIATAVLTPPQACYRPRASQRSEAARNKRADIPWRNTTKIRI